MMSRQFNLDEITNNHTRHRKDHFQFNKLWGVQILESGNSGKVFGLIEKV